MKITVEVPGALSGRPIDELATRARLLLVIDEVRAGQLTRAAAARALDMSLDEFLIEAGRHGLEAIDYEVDDSSGSSPPFRRRQAEPAACWSLLTARR